MSFFRHKNRKNHTKEPEKLPEVPVLCDDLEKISYSAFLKCAVNHDLTPLIVAGQPDERTLFICWITVLSKHYELIGSKDALKYINVVCKMERLNSRINVVSGICEGLRMMLSLPMEFTPDIIIKWTQFLKDWGYKRSFTDKIYEDIEYVERSLQSDNFHLEKAKQDFEKQERDNAKSGKASKEAYMRAFYAVEQYINRNGGNRTLDPESTSLYKFDILFNEMVQYNESLKNTYGKK